MTTRPSISIVYGLLLAATGTTAAAATMPTPSMANLPPERQQGNVAYRTGGIGEDEAKAMQSAARQYPLEIEFVARSGADRGGYLADIDLSIRDSRGNPVMQENAAGPFVLARLPAGHYTITAMNEGKARTQRVDVSAHGTRRVILGW